MIFAAIDIGSNAGRLLIASVHNTKNKFYVDKITLVRVPLRLGLDVFEKGKICSERKNLLIKTLEAYKKLIEVYEPVDTLACATAAMRKAENGAEILDLVKAKTGINLLSIDGKTEAKIISAAGNSNLDTPHKHSLYIDVGGGSTELSYFEKDELIKTASFEIGTIKLLYEKVAKSEWEAIKLWISNLHNPELPINCIGSGGNINKLTKLYGNRSNNTINYKQLSDALVFLESYSLQDRIEKLGLRADRADVIVPAAIIFTRLMKWSNIKEIQAPKIGLADGLIVELYKKHNNMQTVI